MSATEKTPGPSRLRDLLVAGVIFGLVGLIAYLMLSEQRLIDQFHRKFYLNKDDTWAKNHWLGVTALQNPNDVWITQEIITEVKPDFFVECGTAHGGSALIWAMILTQVNPNARVITIDIEDQVAPKAREMSLWKEKIDFLLGSSTSPQIVAEVEKRLQGKKAIVLLDSDHSRKHVLEELKAYSKFVPVGSYLIVQDTNLNGHPIRTRNTEDIILGPWEAIDDFLASNDQFVPDRSRERLMLCFHPRGYLRRIK